MKVLKNGITPDGIVICLEDWKEEFPSFAFGSTKEVHTMKLIFTTQEVIDIGSELYDNHSFTRDDILRFLNRLLDTRRADFDLERVYDIIVG